MKRFFDIFFSLLALIVFLPFGIVIAVILRFTGEGEIFFRQLRVGKGGKKFKLIKFASMLKNSPSMGSGEVTIKNDPRVLPFGHLLRDSKLNEVPQFINVLIGDMSMVGPRPQTEKNFNFFPPEYRNIIQSMRPGLTGIDSIIFRDEETMLANSGMSPDAYYREIIGPYKAKLEMWHREHQNILVYFTIILTTAWVIINPRSEIYRRIWPSLPAFPEIKGTNHDS
jgi:lipopolysaccharide/colanic/teichoic acid biosynthesis glycosyltransferase